MELDRQAVLRIGRVRRELAMNGGYTVHKSRKTHLFSIEDSMGEFVEFEGKSSLFTLEEIEAFLESVKLKKKQDIAEYARSKK